MRKPLNFDLAKERLISMQLLNLMSQIWIVKQAGLRRMAVN
jgi:hypothetical protein